MEKLKCCCRDKELDGKLIFLTIHFDAWLRKSTPTFKISMANRLAKIIKIFDWETDEGKFLLEARQKTNKWEKLDPKDFKYVIKIYYPELVKNKKKGIIAEEVIPRCYPGTKLFLFDVLPDWMIKDLQKEEKNILKVERKITENVLG